MEVKKIEETRSLVRQASALLRGHLQSSHLAPLSVAERQSLRALLQQLQPALGVVRTFEKRRHPRSVYETASNAVAQVLACPALSDDVGQVDGSHGEAQTAANGPAPLPAVAGAEEDGGATTRSGDEHGESGGGGRASTVKPCAPSGTDLTWADMYGCAEAILALRQATTLPLRYPALFTGPRQPWRRLLLYGPPGTGKTQLAAITAAEFGAVFLSVSASDLLSKWVGESEKQVRHAFMQAAAAGPRCVLFFDEIDALCSARGGHGESELARRLKTEFLLHLQTVAPTVVVLAATNLPWELDAAVVRRFERFIYVGLPSSAEKERFLQKELAAVAHTIGPDDVRRIVARTERFSLVDLRRLLSYAVMAPVTEWLSRAAAAQPPLCDEGADSHNTQNASVPTSNPFAGSCRRTDEHREAEVLGETVCMHVGSDGDSSAATADPLQPASLSPGDAAPCDAGERSLPTSPSLSKLESDVPAVEWQHFADALRRVASTATAEEIARYTAWSTSVE